MDMTINKDQGLYVLNHGKYISCLGFEYAAKRAKDISAWCGLPAPEAEPGTAEAFAEYQAAMSAGFQKHKATGERCLTELEPRLIGLEGKRVEVTSPDGTRERFYVSRSTGWLPCHIAVKTRRSLGGCSVYIPPGASIRVVGTR